MYERHRSTLSTPHIYRYNIVDGSSVICRIALRTDKHRWLIFHFISSTFQWQCHRQKRLMKSFCVKLSAKIEESRPVARKSFYLLGNYRFIDPADTSITWDHYAELQTKNFSLKVHKRKSFSFTGFTAIPTSICIYPIFISSKSYFMKPFSSPFHLSTK